MKKDEVLEGEVHDMDELNSRRKNSNESASGSNSGKSTLMELQGAPVAWKALSANGKEKYFTIELPKFNKSLAQLKTDEDRWLYALKNMSSETQVPQLGNRYVEAAYEKLRVGKNPKLLKRMAENMVTEAEIETRMKDGERRGKTMGIEMALEVFQTLGISKAKLAAAKRLLSTCRCF